MTTDPRPQPRLDHELSMLTAALYGDDSPPQWFRDRLRNIVALFDAAPSPDLAAALRNAKNELALTYTNVPADGSRPHWCSWVGKHDATCNGMLATQDEVRAALAPATGEISGGNLAYGNPRHKFARTPSTAEQEGQ